MASVGSMNPLANNFKKKSYKNTGKAIGAKLHKLKVENDDIGDYDTQDPSILQSNTSSAFKNKEKVMIPKIGSKDNSTIGTLLNSTDPTNMGFRSIRHKDRELPRYLIQQAPILKPTEFLPDPWDAANQKRMLKLENSIFDVGELWESLKKIRDLERKIMEVKGLVDRADIAKDLNDAIVFKGTCQDMCPIFERARRSVENNVVRYEKDDPNDKKISRYKAIKVFARPAAAAPPPLPSDVRPPHILVKTLDYIVENIIEMLPDCESFLWDRMRSIRQDFTYQNYFGPETVDCNERIVRIHLLILHIMAKSDIEYSMQQELEQLHKTLITLVEIYDEVRIQGGSCPNEAEFRAYVLLSKIRDPEYDKMIQILPHEIFHADIVQLAICFARIISNSSFMERGYVRTENCLNLYLRFFQLIKSDKVPFLMRLFLEVYINEVRFYAIKAISMTISKKHKSIPFKFFFDNLLFSSNAELLAFCNYYSIDVDETGVLLKSLQHKSHLIPETKPMRQAYLECVDEKLQSTSYISLINSGHKNIQFLPKTQDFSLSNIFQTDISPEPWIENKNAFNEFSTSENMSNKVLKLNSLNEKQDSCTLKEPSINFAISKLPDPATTLETTKTPGSNIINNSLVPETNSFISFSGKSMHLPSNFSKTTPRFSSTPQTFQNKVNFIQENTNQVFKSNDIELVNDEILPKFKNSDKKASMSEITPKHDFKNFVKMIECNKVREETVIQIADCIIKSVVEKNLTKLVKNEIEGIKKKNYIMKKFSKELFNAFIHETVYFVYSETKADLIRENKLLQYCFNIWKFKYDSKKFEREFLEKRKMELVRVGKQLGIPIVKIPRSNDGNTISSSILQNNSSFMKSPRLWVETPVASETNRFTTQVRKNTALWEPIDLKIEYCNLILSNNQISDFTIMSGCKNQAVEIGLYVFSKRWDNVSGTWLLSKFSINEFSPLKLNFENLNLSVVKLNNDYNPNDFNNLQLLVFNTGVTDSDIFDLEMKMKQDGEKLVELVHGISLNSNYRCKILIVHWSSTENRWNEDDISKYLKLNKIKKIFGVIVQSISIAIMDGDRPDKILAKCLRSIAENFKLELTERGEYNRNIMKRNLAGAGGISLSMFSNTSNTNTIDEKLNKLLEMEKLMHTNCNKKKILYSHLQNHVNASPKLKKTKLPVLLSDRNKAKYRTPINILNSRDPSSNSIASSHLAAKGKHLLSPMAAYGTPSQVRPFEPLNSRLVLHTPSIPIAGTANTTDFSNMTFSPFFVPINQKLKRPCKKTHYSNHEPDLTNSKFDSSLDNITSVHPVVGFSIAANDENHSNAKTAVIQNPSQPSDSLLELKSLIASVKNKLKN